jgi:LIVCS family branched-chain amino acid:cation transporter
MSHKTKDIFILGFGIFAFLFGAGNLIFPPTLGSGSGSAWWLSLLGFITTDVLLSVLCIHIFNKYKNFKNFAAPMGNLFTNLYIYLTVIFVVLLLVVPRTAATTFEIAIKPYLPHLNPWIFYIIYFIFVAILSINPSKVFDNIGKILSPLLYIFILVLIFSAVFKVHPNYTSDPSIKNPFSYGFTQGYQTIDALAASLQASLSIMVLTSKKYHQKEIPRMILLACLIVIVLLSTVYLGLTYLGAALQTNSPLHEIDTLVLIVQTAAGTLGKVILGFAILFACITTAIGDMVLGPFLITELVGQKKSSKESKKLYSTLIIIFTILGIFIAKGGVDKILSIASPILTLAYPILIVMTILNAFNMREKLIMRTSVYLTLFISIIDVLKQLNPSNVTLNNIVNTVPLGKEGFLWLIPFILAALITKLIVVFKKQKVEHPKQA